MSLCVCVCAHARACLCFRGMCSHVWCDTCKYLNQHVNKGAYGYIQYSLATVMPVCYGYGDERTLASVLAHMCFCLYRVHLVLFWLWVDDLTVVDGKMGNFWIDCKHIKVNGGNSHQHWAADAILYEKDYHRHIPKMFPTQKTKQLPSLWETVWWFKVCIVLISATLWSQTR